MKIVRLTYYVGADKRFHWAATKIEALQYRQYLISKKFLKGIPDNVGETVVVPTKKLELIDWLNANATR